MKLSISGDIGLASARAPYVTWLDVRIGDDSDATTTLGIARVAIVHVGEIADGHGDLGAALHGTGLDALGGAYFAHGWYKDEFADGAGLDLLYVQSIEMDDGQRGKNVDLATVRRLCDTLGSGCQLAVMPYVSAHSAAHWTRLGFTVTTPGRSSGLMHMKLGHRHARVIDATGAGDFEVLPTSVVHDRHTHN